MRRVITSQTVTAEGLKRQAVEECEMTTLYWDAMEKIRAGPCSLDDALAKVRKDEFDARPGWMFTELGLPIRTIEMSKMSQRHPRRHIHTPPSGIVGIRRSALGLVGLIGLTSPQTNQSSD